MGHRNFTSYPQMLKGELLEYICPQNHGDMQHMVGRRLFYLFRLSSLETGNL